MVPGRHTRGLGSRERGFSYVVVLFALALFSVGLAAVGQATSDAARREHEADLIRTGNEIVRAIASYYYSSPGSVPTLPKTWDDLVDDKRFVGVRRHLRRVPLDPLSNSAEWGELRDSDGALIGVYSRSEKQPFRSQALEIGRLKLVAAAQYSDWKFKFVPEEGMR